jgi:uncharacterized membrane protein YtjA (UPF0391 family)
MAVFFLGRRRSSLGDAVGPRRLFAGLVAFLVAVILLTLLGFGGATGNATGLLFWSLVVVLVVALTYARLQNRELEVTSEQRPEGREQR